MEEYTFEKDALYRYVPYGNPLPDFQQTYVKKLVITKEMFEKCYKKWIYGNGDTDRFTRRYVRFDVQQQNIGKEI